SLGATMPRRTLSPRISTTVTTTSLLMTMLSFFFLDSTSIAAYPFQCRDSGALICWFPRVSCNLKDHAVGGNFVAHAGEDTLLLPEPAANLDGRASADPVDRIATLYSAETSSHFNLSVRAQTVKGLSALFFHFIAVWHATSHDTTTRWKRT